MKKIALAVFAAACLLGACDTAPPAYASTAPPVQAGAACPVGMASMGCSIAPNRAPRVVIPTLNTGAPSGEWIPDVSSYQPNVDWAAVKAWQVLHGWKIQGGIFKLGENVADPYASQNARDLHKDGMIAIGYWFIRPSGATEEAGEILAEASALHIHVVALDEEVAGIQGYASVIAPILQKAGYTVIDYHSAGNVLDTTAGGLLCWVADYGPLTPPVCTTGKRVAWQFEDVGQIPGIAGGVDVSVSYGLLKLAEPPAPPKPVVKPKPVIKPKPVPVHGPLVCFGPRQHRPPRQKACVAVVKQHNWLVSRRIHWGHVMYAQRAHKQGAAYKHAAHFYYLRRGQAVTYLHKYSAK